VHEPLGEHLQSPDDPARDAGNSELRRELCSALGNVSPEQAQVVLLKDALGYSFEEIAEAAGMPVGTAKCHAHRGRARLSERLEDTAA
jgi:RNA polymerase sigma factor (sigma-70 family)